jgi:hypothetical protein
MRSKVSTKIPAKPKFEKDPLYHLFEQHLFSALVDEASTDQFVDRVVKDYMSKHHPRGAVPYHLLEVVRIDLRDEVLAMLRKKTYGHYSLDDYRKSLKNRSA